MTTDTAVEYAFTNTSAQLSALARYLDPITIQILARTGIQPGHHFLELGPGGGSIAAWAAEQVGPTGQVTVIDRDTNQLQPAPNMAVHTHDLQTGLPPAVAAGPPADRCYARLLLVHLPNRAQLLHQLVGILNPGGWLVLGEFSAHPLTVLASRSPADAALFTKVIDTFTRVLTDSHGADTSWAGKLHDTMTRAGLEHVTTIEYAESWTGAYSGNQLHIENMRQKRAQLVAAGLTPAELDRFEALMADPGFAARSWQFVCTRGRKPANR